MADEMVLIPRVRYERLLKEENDRGHSSSTRSEELLNTQETSKSEAEAEAKAESKSESKSESKAGAELEEDAVDKSDKSGTSKAVKLVQTPTPGLTERNVHLSNSEPSSKKKNSV
jgi:hypothetical protein